MTQATAPQIPIPNPVDPTGTVTGWVVDALGQGQKVATGLTGGVGGVTAAVDSIVATRRWIGDRHNWLRVAWFMAGSGLLMVGLTILVRKPAMATLDATGLNPKNIISTATKAI
jgi:hypothetical protein